MRDTFTSQSLVQWHEGDQKGLDNLLDRHLTWIHNVVRNKVGPFLRKKADTVDYVHNAIVDFLRYGPRVMISSDDHFRNLFARIVENMLRDQHGWYTARRRAISHERPLPRDTVLCLDPIHHRVKSPSVEAQEHEREAWVRLGIELLEPEDRKVLVLRQWDALSFDEIGKRIGISGDAARMRTRRAIKRLGEIVGELRSGKLPVLEGDPCD